MTWSAEEGVALDDLVPAGTDPDRRHPCTDELLDPQDVGAGVGRQLLERAAGRDVLRPAREVLVDGLRVVEVALAHRHLVVALSAHVIGDADRHLIEPGEDIELGDDKVCDTVDPRRIAPDHRVHPAAATGPTSRGAVLSASLAQELTLVVKQLSGERTFAHPRGVGLCLLYTSPSPRDGLLSRMPSSA